MNLLITGICGFVGSTIARAWLAAEQGLSIFGVDNFARPGSELNRRELRNSGVRMIHADLRNASDLASLPRVDWVIDAAANPSVLAGVDGRASSRQVVEHNLWGTVNILEYCRTHRAGLILLSTSRVYSIRPLETLPVDVHEKAFRPSSTAHLPAGITLKGVSEGFPTTAPISLYGGTKLASECLALEYGEAFNFPVWVNRCGVLAGAGQFGKPDQGIFSFWINAHMRRRPLKFIGFSGFGFQVRDCLHPRDLVPMLRRQAASGNGPQPRVVNLSGGTENSISLARLTDWCDARFGHHTVTCDLAARPFDIPWMVLDHSLAFQHWGWQPTTRLEDILVEIACHAEQHPEWLEVSEA